MQTRALLVCVLATLALAQAYTIPCDINVVITGPNTDGYEGCSSVLSVTITNNAQIHTINFPTITYVFGDVIIENNPNLETIPWSVHTITGKLSVQNNAYLYGWFNYLQHLTGDVTIVNNDQLTSASMPDLQEANSLYVKGNSHLQVLEAPVLTSMQYSLHFQDCPLLTTLNLPVLNYAESLYYVDTGLTTVHLPALTQTEGGVWITNNPALQYVEMQSVTFIGGPVFINYNYNGNTMSQFNFLALNYFMSWESQPVYSFISCNGYLDYYYNAYCPTAQSVAAKPASYPAIQEKKKTKKDFFEAKLKLATKATPAKAAQPK